MGNADLLATFLHFSTFQLVTVHHTIMFFNLDSISPRTFTASRGTDVGFTVLPETPDSFQQGTASGPRRDRKPLRGLQSPRALP